MHNWREEKEIRTTGERKRRFAQLWGVEGEGGGSRTIDLVQILEVRQLLGLYIRPLLATRKWATHTPNREKVNKIQ